MQENIINRPHAVIAPVPPEQIRWREGFWAEKYAMIRDVTLPGMLDALNDPQNGAFLGNFIAVAERRNEHRATFWSDGDCYKFLEALTNVYRNERDPKLLELMDRIIASFAGAQEPDGYINTQITLTGKPRWSDPRLHEFYNLGHLFTAAANHFRTTGQRNFLVIAERAADCVYATFSSRPKALAHYEFNPSNIMGLVDLYEVTDDPRHLELAQIFVDLRGSEPGGLGDQNQDGVPLREEKEAVGHAVTATYLYSGAADVAMHTGEQALADALGRIWDDATRHKLYITGGVGAIHAGMSERDDKWVDADKIWEAFGRPYQLPNASAYNETCANIGQAMWAWRMLQMSGEVRYADVMEQVLYNAGLSGISLRGSEFTYTNPLRWHGHDHSDDGHLLFSDAPQRWNRFFCYCCPPQVARTYSGLQRWVASQSADALWIHLYGGNEVHARLESGRLRLSMRTEYPWDGLVAIEVLEAPKKECSLRLRIPHWATGATCVVNGQSVDRPVAASSYIELQRHWRAGDTVELDLPMEARLMIGHPRVEETRNQVAVVRGPVVYCLEHHDLPQGVALEDILIPSNARFALSEDAVGTARMLTGSGLHIPRRETDRLYAPLEDSSAVTVLLKLVPYHAWNNRGITNMSVWLPLAAAAA